jgi:hypothetical protein
MHRNSLNSFLKARGYDLERSETFKSFGDYVQQFSSPTIKIRLSSSKSYEALDVCSVKEPNNWYDVALIMTLINGGRKPNQKTAIAELTSFLSENLEQVEAMFDTESYNRTKEKLGELEKERVSKMFPNL